MDTNRRIIVLPHNLMNSEAPRTDVANADILLWQTGYRLVLALVAGIMAVGLRNAGILTLSSVAYVTVGPDSADRVLGLVAATYVVLVTSIRALVQRTRAAGRTLSTLMVVADLMVVFLLVFLLAEPNDYHRGLLLALFSLQLTHVYFGRAPALLLLAAIAAAFLLINDIAQDYSNAVSWPEALTTLGFFGLGSLLVIRVQSKLHERLGTLVAIFERAEEGDFTNSYDVAADKSPDAITTVGRAYNRMRTQLASIVQTDPLSGCYNRRGFEQQYRRELARAARTQTDVALIAIDLDFFKQVNDTHGHLVGDQVIAETGELLRASARTDDIVARTGGEEFMILAPNTSAAGAQHLALRVVEAFRRRTFAEPKAKVAVTVSVGVVSDTVPDESIAEALRARADEALYAAKRSGRNRVVLWSHGLDALRRGQTSGEFPPVKV
ncbi:diguanylate cyclase [Gemmatimonas sp.]|uniref:GGDEF domain-containing protein n=1 Tax=Gemmatimonas sp. TaxID=1962908 RepID=UPI003563E82B